MARGTLRRFDTQAKASWVVSLVAMAGVVILEAWPVYLFLSSRFRGGEAQVSMAPLLMGVAGAGVLTILATWLPLRAGIRKVQSADF